MPEKPGGGLLERQDIGDVTVLRVRAPLLRDNEITERLFGEVFAVLDEPGGRKLVLNLGPVEYVASVVARKLAVLSRKGRGRLARCRVSPTVDRTLEATHLADVLAVFGDEGEAVGSFA
jgi:anti-anti-sigma factor